MEFDSFEDALKVCMTAEENSQEQDAALEYCLVNAPPELKKKLKEYFEHRHAHSHGCGCQDK